MPSYWERLSQNQIATTIINAGLSAAANYVSDQLNSMNTRSNTNQIRTTTNSNGTTVLDSQNGLSHNVNPQTAMSNWPMEEYQYDLHTKASFLFSRRAGPCLSANGWNTPYSSTIGPKGL